MHTFFAATFVTSLKPHTCADLKGGGNFRKGGGDFSKGGGDFSKGGGDFQKGGSPPSPSPLYESLTYHNKNFAETNELQLIRIILTHRILLLQKFWHFCV